MTAVIAFVAGGLFALLIVSLADLVDTRRRLRRIRYERVATEAVWQDITAGEWPW